MSNAPAKAFLTIAGIASAVKIGEWLTTSKHDRLVKKTAKEIEWTASDATLLVDHGVEVGDGQPETIGGFRPDLVVRDFPRFFAVEVETKSSLDAHASEQLEAFASKQNYTAVLVVPSSTKAEAEKFVKNRVDADVRVATPSDVV